MSAMAATPLKQVRFAVKNIFHSPPTSPSARHTAFSFGGAAAAMSVASVPATAKYTPQVPSSAPPTRTSFYYPQHPIGYHHPISHAGQPIGYARSHGSAFGGVYGPVAPSSTPSVGVVPKPTPRSILRSSLATKQPTAKAPLSVNVPVHPHPLLSHQLVDYDLRDHPTSLTYHSYPLSITTLTEPATTPPVPFVSLKCVYLPKQIKVYAANGAFITLNDIFCTLYNTLRCNLTEADFYGIGSSSDKKRTLKAYEKRYRRIRDPRAYDQEKMGGLKVVDLLLEHVEFAGLSKGHTPIKAEEWYLHVR